MNQPTPELLSLLKYMKEQGWNDFNILLKVPEHQIRKLRDGWRQVAIIDLETTGLSYKTDKITEIGILKLACWTENINDILVTGKYESFNDPGIPITEKITKLTGITYEMVKGQSIDWALIERSLKECDVIVCHNANFDRKFLEQSPIRNFFLDKTFACTKNDVDWKRRGYGANKLDYINWKLGYFYDAHRAINDCWATVNLLAQEDGALVELLENAKDQCQIYAVKASFDKKEELQQAGFRWNDGMNDKPKAWFITVNNDEDIARITKFINIDIGCACKYVVIPSNRKYSSEV